MQPSRRHFLATAIVLATLPVAAFAAQSGPADFLNAIYGQYAPGKDGVTLDDAAALRRVFTPSLAELIQHDRAMAEEADDLPTLDGDPFVDAQDWDITDLDVKVEDLGGGRAVGHVTFRNFGEAKTVELDLVRTTAGWRIDDVKWGDASLRGLYTH